MTTASRPPTISRASWADPMEVFDGSKSDLVASVAPKPPKKRFLEAAAAAQLEEEEKAVSSRPAEDNSALMHLAEMCVIYQKSDQHTIRYIPFLFSTFPLGNILNFHYRPRWKRESPIYTLSPANTPFWGWANRSSEQHLSQNTYDNQEEENEEPLDLSGEETIRTNQQELIDHLVEKLCARPLSGSTIKSALVQPKLSLLAKQQASSVETSSNNNEFEVSSSSVMSTTTTGNGKATDVMRKDLPLKKRDSSLGMVAQCDSTANSGSSSGNNSVSSGGSPSPPASELAVTSTNGSSKKPAPRSCKGKRYLEFMYEGRISVLGTGRATSNSSKRAESAATDTVDLTTTTACDQSNVVGRKRRSAAAQRDPAPSAFTSLRGHQRSTNNNKSRKIS